MTQRDIDELDARIFSGDMSDEEYYGTLRDEVSRLHPELDYTELENMLAIQLKTLAVDTQFSAGMFESEPPDEVGERKFDEIGEKGSEQHDDAADGAEAESLPAGESDGAEAESLPAGESDGAEEDSDASGEKSGGDDDGNGGSQDDEDDGGGEDDNRMIWWNFQWVPKWFLGLDTRVLSDENGKPVFVGSDTVPVLTNGEQQKQIEAN